MTNNKDKTLEERLERLELSEPNSKGCSICLAEFLRHENTQIILDFIKQEQERLLREVLKLDVKREESVLLDLSITDILRNKFGLDDDDVYTASQVFDAVQFVVDEIIREDKQQIINTAEIKFNIKL